MLALICSISIFATRYLVQTGAPGAATWRAAGAGEVLVDLTVNGQTLNVWYNATVLSADEVWIASGTYVLSAAVTITKANHVVYGGFAGTETIIGERIKVADGYPWEFTNETILDGNNAVQVLFANSAYSNVIFDGITITKGSASNAAAQYRDGVTLQNCKIINNTSTGNGGGVNFFNGGSIINSYIAGNVAGIGGGVYSNNGSANISIVSGCLIENNRATNASHGGGGVRTQGSGTGTTNVINCVIRGNKGLAADGETLIRGGAISTNNPNCNFNNCLIYNNEGASAISSAGGNFTNITVVNNVGQFWINSASAPYTITNSIIWGNKTDATGATNTGVTSNTTNTNVVINNTAVYPGLALDAYTQANNIALELSNNSQVGAKGPGFVAPTTFWGAPTNSAQTDEYLLADWNIKYTSGCLDLGKTVAGITTDIAGTSRPQGSAYDIGAYELAYYNTTVTFNAGGTVNTFTSGDILSEPKGKQLVFNITPNSGQLLVSVKFNGSTVTTVDNGNGTFTYTTPTLSANGDLDVEFKTITQLNITGGTLSAKGYTVAELAESHFTLTSGELIIDESASIHSLTLSPSSKLTISTGTLTATNAITLQSDATGTATLKNSGTYSGNITAQQYLGTARNWYVSSPVSSASAPATNVDYYYEYVEAGDNNPTGQPGSSTVYWKGLANGSTMDVGKGYIAKTNAGTTVAFSGTPNNGNITTLFDLTRNESAGKGFNLVGNPYPSYINWTSVAAANPNLDNTYYYRTQNTDNSYAFVTWNGAGNTFVNSKGGTANTSITSLIPPTQAFWVRVKSGTTATKMHFNNDMREHRDDNGNLMKMPRRDTRPTVRMQLQNGNNADEMLIYQDADANNNYDSYDSPKMLNNSTTLPDLYSIVGNERLVINGFGTIYHNMEVPLGFSLKSAASLRIKASELNYLPVGMSVYLLDKLTNTQTQLTSETEYSFTTTEANINNESRFSLVFKSLGSTTSVNESELSKHTVFVNAQNELVIIAAENSRYAIYTIVGEMISAGTIANKALIINSIAKGVYIVNVNNQSSKVIIQ